MTSRSSATRRQGRESQRGASALEIQDKLRFPFSATVQRLTGNPGSHGTCRGQALPAPSPDALRCRTMGRRLRQGLRSPPTRGLPFTTLWLRVIQLRHARRSALPPGRRLVCVCVGVARRGPGVREGIRWPAPPRS
ncbi:hypothetical protein NDU88_002160 [Pleurodeles waltl]|uniref:Uncharacterized protein n=1 Tax=Pleurodeles waltl TaxID=8319 RepID=A0AAV7MLU8_PLEWA|nr:hypothetical protein NDU88_002160 [Pleurodeles waltl]